MIERRRGDYLKKCFAGEWYDCHLSVITFVFLSNIENITFEQAWKASGFSSNTNDYFKAEDAKFVALK